MGNFIHSENHDIPNDQLAFNPLTPDIIAAGLFK